MSPTKPPPTRASKLWPSQNPSVAPMSIAMIGIVSGLPDPAELTLVAAQCKHAGFQRFGRDLRGRHRRRDHEVNFGKPAAPVPHRLPAMRARKETAPQTPELHRNDGHRRPCDHLLNAGSKPIQLSGFGQFALRKD